MDMAAVWPTEPKPGYHRQDLNGTLWEVPERYGSFTPVGHGAFGQVCSAYDQERKAKIAVKKLARPFQSVTHAKRTYREVKMLKHMNHENIIGLLDCFTPSQSHEAFGDVYLITHLMQADLNNIVKTQNLTGDHVELLVYQMLRGLKYVHSAGIIHRDLKPSNMAVNENCELKILDFGLARQADDEMTGYVATRWYRAPEIMLNWMHYNQTVDVWSVGCIMAELITGRTLFPGNGYIDQIKKIIQLVGTPSEDFIERISSEEARKYMRSLPKTPKKDFKECFPNASDQAIDLMEKMLDLDGQRRITAEAALKHPYLAQYHLESDEPIAEPFNDCFKSMEHHVEEWKSLVFEELASFKPRAEQL